MAGVATRKDDRLRHNAMSRWVRYDLRMLRENLGWTLQKAAATSRLNYRTIGRVETGADPASHQTISLLCDAYGAPAEKREQLQEMNRIARSVGWWDRWRDVQLEAGYAEHIELEGLADGIWFYSPTTFAGFLQCQEYAEFVQRVMGPRDATYRGRKAQRYVDLRMERHRRIVQRTGLTMQILLDRVAFSRVPEPILQAQLDHLRQLSTDGVAEFRLTPEKVPLALYGTICLLSVRGRTTVCTTAGLDFHVDDLSDREYVESTQVVFEDEWARAIKMSDAADWKHLT